MFGALAKEQENWRIRLVDVQAGDERHWENLFAIPFDGKGRSWAYRDGQWLRQRLVERRLDIAKSRSLKDGGVYVLIGGAGAIGEAWTREAIIAHQVQAVWIGRRPEDEAIRTKIESMAKIGPKPVYIQADAADEESLSKAYKEIKRRFSEINGLIHSAKVLGASRIEHLDETVFETGFRSKAGVCVAIERVFKNESLDFVMFFSSIVSFVRDRGQSHYSAGSTFLDVFALGSAHRLNFL